MVCPMNDPSRATITESRSGTSLEEPASLLSRGLTALLAAANPEAVRKRRKAERMAALAEGRKALGRLKALERSPGDVPAACAPAARAIETLEAAVLSLDAIRTLLDQAGELVAAARDPEAHDGTRALLAERYDELREDIDRIALTAYAGRTNLLDGLGAELDVPLDTTGRSRVAVHAADATCGEAGLALPPPRDAFAGAGERDAIAAAIEAARNQASALAQRFEIDAALLAARLNAVLTPARRRSRRA